MRNPEIAPVVEKPATTPEFNSRALQARLDASLAYRSTHRKKASASLTDTEASTEDFHPDRRGLFCDAPLGLKY